MSSDLSKQPSHVGNGRSSRVLGVGVAALDIVNLVAEYPMEDAEVRALEQRIVRGGNAANSLAVLCQFGHRCTWAGTLADDAGSDFVRDDLDRRGIDREPAVTVPGAHMPTSYIAVSRATGSRTIIHHRDLREFSARDFDGVALGELDWIHFEGRAPDETAQMIDRVRRERPELPISVEIEKSREGIDRLFHGPDLLIFSRAFAEATPSADRHPGPEAFLHQLMAVSNAGLCLLPWGSAGAYGLARDGEVLFAPARRPARVIDTLGAGDVFNAAVIDARLRGFPLPMLLAHANAIAGHKCGRHGFDGLIDSALEAGLV
ncbi:MAG TPA: ketohexokinase [Chromatiaceae bacterium]|jgi:ketohexokinase|nr:MAG: ketohexokinase [Thiohalocapsa sp. PB-PSB1]HBG95994.1 ketohexokinase [Chromatiaceae bacterium]HCS90897.1 ketohexokinase [Chromatiaceae bacterium]